MRAHTSRFMITMKVWNPDNPGLIQITWFNSDESLDIYLAYDTLAMLFKPR